MHPQQQSPLETSLQSLTEAIEAWNPDTGQGTDAILAWLREVQLHFDPRQQRLPAALCMSCMRLLEEICGYGSVRPVAAVYVVRDLAEHMREALAVAPPPPARTTFRTLPISQDAVPPAMPSGPNAQGLSLRLVDDLRIGEMMVKMSMISQAQCELVLRAQAEAPGRRRLFGDMCVELGILSREAVDSALRLQHREGGRPTAAGDPWGDKPL